MAPRPRPAAPLVLYRLLLFVAAATSAASAPSLCDAEACHCDGATGAVTCSCAGREQQELSLGAADGGLALPVNTASLHVERCASVTVGGGAVSQQARLRLVHVAHVGQLRLRTGAFGRDADTLETFGALPPLAINIERSNVTAIESFAFRSCTSRPPAAAAASSVVAESRGLASKSGGHGCGRSITDTFADTVWSSSVNIGQPRRPTNGCSRSPVRYQEWSHTSQQFSSRGFWCVLAGDPGCTSLSAFASSLPLGLINGLHPWSLSHSRQRPASQYVTALIREEGRDAVSSLSIRHPTRVARTALVGSMNSAACSQTSPRGAVTTRGRPSSEWH